MLAETSEPQTPQRPDIHIWMNESEAAAILGTSESILSCQIELGELETRVDADGRREVLVCLPPRREGAETSSMAVRDRQRGGRAGWIVAGILLLVACGAGAIATRLVLAAHQQAQELSGQFDRLTSDAAKLAGERNQLLQQLSDAHEAIARAQRELAVERKIEDTLIQGALAAKAKMAAGQPSQVADGAE